MFGSIKKAMAVAAVVAIGAVAPAVASADQWTTDGVNPYAGTAHVSGTLQLRVTANGATTTCPVTASLDLTNPGGVAHGQVTSFILGTAAGGPCSTSLPNCAVTATANTTTPWTVATSGTSVTISGINFTNNYTSTGGGTCALAGVPVNATGSITGTASGDTITFTNAAGISTPFGPATVTGSVTARDTSSPANPISLF